MMNYGLGNAMMQRDGAPQMLGGGLFGGAPADASGLAQALLLQSQGANAPQQMMAQKQKRPAILDLLFNPPLLSMMGIDLGRVLGIDKTRGGIER